MVVPCSQMAAGSTRQRCSYVREPCGHLKAKQCKVKTKSLSEATPFPRSASLSKAVRTTVAVLRNLDSFEGRAQRVAITRTVAPSDATSPRSASFSKAVRTTSLWSNASGGSCPTGNHFASAASSCRVPSCGVVSSCRVGGPWDPNSHQQRYSWCPVGPSLVLQLMCAALGRTGCDHACPPGCAGQGLQSRAAGDALHACCAADRT